MIRFLGLLALLLLSACETIRYEYRPPVTDQGRMCITQCAAIKETCRGNEIQRAQREKASCERSNESHFRACLAKASGKEEVKACEKDHDKRSCWGLESTYRCEEDYRTCFVNCGGAIIVHKEK
ncbi:MAG: hypothetical protein HYS18_02270 [Burkholderiales bacterium]|nr:hypothetical protein [Burkholderiales bacterium]